eukprot:g46520.t1
MPNFLSRLRKKRRCCAFLAIAPTWEVQVKLSVIVILKNLMLFTLSTSVPTIDTDRVMYSVRLSEFDDQLLCFAMVKMKMEKKVDGDDTFLLDHCWWCKVTVDWELAEFLKLILIYDCFAVQQFFVIFTPLKADIFYGSRKGSILTQQQFAAKDVGFAYCFSGTEETQPQ